MSSVKYIAVPFHEVASVIAQYQKKHAEDYDGGVPNIDCETYLALSQSGECVALCAVYNEKVIGYNVFLIQPDINRKNIIDAQNTAIFVLKEHRSKGIAKKLVQFAESYFKDSPVTTLNYFVKKGSLERFFKMNGYSEDYSVMVKSYE